MLFCIFFFPFPDMAEEFFAGIVFALFSLCLHEVSFDDGLGGDACVVGAWHPEGFKPDHSLPADEDVLQRIDESMAHMESAGDIGRGDDDAIGRFVAVGDCL